MPRSRIQHCVLCISLQTYYTYRMEEVGAQCGAKRRHDDIEEVSSGSDSEESIEVEEDMLPGEPYAFCGALRKYLMLNFDLGKIHF